MDILIIGGTKFVGKAIVEVALAQGHHLSLFHRGQTNPELFPKAEHLFGDRNSDLSALAGRRWDVVIDTSAYFPHQVRRLLDTLNKENPPGQYVFISTISVYRDTHNPNVDEQHPVGTIPDETIETITNETYGPLKALCERAAESKLPGRVLTIRPGLIVGPYDPSDRFTYWPNRIRRGGEVLAPGEPNRLIQFIDVRDLAEWTMRLVEAGRTGIFNATGRPDAITMEALLLTCKQVSGTAARLCWVDDEFLLEQNIGPWIEMPLWIPESDPDATGFFSINIDKALRTGLTFRPVTETIHAILEWATSRPADYAWKAGLAPEREAQLLEVYSARSQH